MHHILCLETRQHFINALRNICRSEAHVQQVHSQAISRGLLSLHASPLLPQILHALSSVNSLSESAISYSRKLFFLIPSPTSFNYNAIVRTHIRLGCPANALCFYARMRGESVAPDFHTFPFALKACGLLPGSLPLAKNLHSELIKFGLWDDLFVCNTLACAYCRFGEVGDARGVLERCTFRDVVGYNVLIDGYVKIGEIDNARGVFDEMPSRDAVSWGTLLAGYASSSRATEAIGLSDTMLELNVEFDNVALVSALSACAQIGELEKGKRIHHYVNRKGVELDSYLGTALVDFYAKCGYIDKAKEIFWSCNRKTVPLWNAMLVGLAMHGEGNLLLDYFSRMIGDGIRPDGVSVLGVLVGCSHSGLINEAIAIFASMDSVYHVPRELKHYGCMADLLGRAGYIREAMTMIDEMKSTGDIFVWGGLLGGCKIHGNLDVAEAAAKRVMKSNPEDGGVYSELVHLYAGLQRWDDVVKVRSLRDGKWGVKKNAGCSLIQLNGINHEFLSGDSVHFHSEEILFILNGMELHQYESHLINGEQSFAYFIRR